LFLPTTAATFLLHVCLFFFFFFSSLSSSSDTVQFNYFSGTTCSGMDNAYVFQDTCIVDTDADDGDYGYDYDYDYDYDDYYADDQFGFTLPPSLSTTSFPTAPLTGSSSMQYMCMNANAPSIEPSAAPSQKPHTGFPSASDASYVTIYATQVLYS
jgi:hypothetical protein